MKLCICFIIYKIFGVCSYTINLQNSQNDNHRSVNLALETVLEFNQKDHSGDIQILDNVQKFINRVKTVINKNKNFRRDSRDVKVENLTDFIREVIAIINTYEEPDFQEAFDIFDEEIRKYHYRGCKFYELTENHDIRKLLAANLDLIRGKPVHVIKQEINSFSKILQNESYEKYIKDLVDYINSLYKEVSKDKFKQVLTDLDMYPKSKLKKTYTDLVKIIREAIRSIIFDHYTNLNPNARRELKNKIESFWKYFKLIPSRHFNSHPKTEYSTNGVKKPDYVSDSINTKKGEPTILAPKYLVPVLIGHKDVKPVPNEKDKIKNVEPEREENKQIQHITATGNVKRIEVKKTDYKKPRHMRNGMKEQSKIEEDQVWKGKYTKFGRNNVDPPDLLSLQTSQKVARSFQHTTKKTIHRDLKPINTDESVTGETFEANSIEQYPPDEEETTNQRYITLYPEPISYKPTQKDQFKIVHRSKKITRMPRIQTLWVEESTGQLPRSYKRTTRNTKHTVRRHKQKHKLRNKSDNKSHVKHEPNTHKPKHSNKHKSEHKQTHMPEDEFEEKREHKREHKSKHSSTHKKRHEKPNKSILRMNPDENNALVHIESPTMELHEPSKKLESMKPAPRHLEMTTQPTAKSYLTHPFTFMSTRWNGAPARFAKRYQSLSSPLNKPRDFRKSIAPSLKSDESLSIEKFNRDKKLYYATSKMSLKYSTKTYSPNETVVIDQNVMNRIRDLEKELNDVKSRISENKYEVVAKNDKSKKSEPRAKEDRNLSSEEERIKQINDKFDPTVEKGLELSGQIIIMKDKEKEEKKVTQLKHGDNDAITETVKVLNSKVTKLIDIKQDAKRTEVNTTKYMDSISQVKKVKGEAKVKLVNEEAQPNNEKRHVEDIENYEEVDEWQDTFKRNAISGFTTITASTVTTTKAGTTVKPTANTTSPTKTTMVEKIIAVSSSNKPSNIIRNDNDDNDDVILPKDYSPLKSLPQKESIFNISVSKDLNTKEVIEKEIKNTYKTIGLSMATENESNATKAIPNDPISFRKVFDASFPTLSPQENSRNAVTMNHLFTDPFLALDDGFDFLNDI